MFLNEDARAQRLRRIVGHHRYGPLDDDRPVIELSGDQMDRDAGNCRPVLQRLAWRIDPGEGRQQGRMDIEDSVGKRLEQRRPNEAHVAGKANQADISRTQLTSHRTVVLISERRSAMIKADRLDTGPPRAFEARRVRSIGNNDRDCRVEAPVTSSVDQRLKVAAAPRDQNTQAAVHGRLT